jgi:hypothetical protein
MILADRPETTTVPLAPAARWIELLFWVFLFSFAFDYRAPEGSSSSSILQFGFLALCLGATGGIMLLGWQSLFVRPMAWLIAGWGLFLAILFVNSVLIQAVPLARFVRVVLPFVLCFLGLVNAHAASCAGLRLARIATPIYLVAIINVVWRIIHGFLFAEATMDTARVEILSPALTWVAAFIGCALLLRARLHWTLFLATAVFLTALFLSVTRGLLFPIAASAGGAALAFLHCLRWRVFPFSEVKRRLLPIGTAMILGLVAGGIALVALPNVRERWEERLFSPTSDRNMVADPSLLSRKAEAAGIIEILNDAPLHYLHGKGVGASYYWHPKYLSQLYQIYPEGTLDGTKEIWFAGHSIWTYALFSGGVIGVGAFLALFAFAIVVSFRAAAANASDPGPDHWILYLSMITTLGLLSQSITSNPFDERLLGLLFGATIGLTQAGFIRASWIGATNEPPTSEGQSN